MKFLFRLSPKPIQFGLFCLLTFAYLVMPTPAQAMRSCVPTCGIKDGMTRGGESIRKGLQDAHITAHLDYDDVEHVYNRTEAMLGYANAQMLILSKHANKDFRGTLDKAFEGVEDSVQAFDQVTEKRLSQMDDMAKENMLLLFKSIDSQIHAASDLMTQQINAIDEAANNFAKTTGIESRETILTASDELAALLDLSRDNMDDLLQRSSHEVSQILAQTEGSLAYLIELSSQEAQDTILFTGRTVTQTSTAIIEKAGDTTQIVIEEVGITANEVIDNGADRAEDLIGLTGDEARETVGMAGDEARDVVGVFGQEARETVEVAGDEVINITDHLSDETKEVLQVATENMTYLATHTSSTVSSDIQAVVKQLETSQLRVIRGGLVFIDRTAELTLSVGAVSAGLIFFFITSYGWGRGILKHNLPEKYAVRGVVLSLMGTTFLASFTPFVFLMPSVKAAVLRPIPYDEVVSPYDEALGLTTFNASIERFEPATITIDTTTPAHVPYLRVYGDKLTQGTPIAKFGDIKLPILDKNDRLLVVDLSPIYEDPNNADHIAFYSRQGSYSEDFLEFIEVVNRIPSDDYNKAINKANDATNRTQKAKTNRDWTTIVSLWTEARDLMQSVAPNSQHYATAQQKAVIYQSSLDHAKTMEAQAPAPASPSPSLSPSIVRTRNTVSTAIAHSPSPSPSPAPRSSSASSSSSRSSNSRSTSSPLARLSDRLYISDREQAEFNITSANIQHINRLADISFYKNNPELNGRAIREGELSLMVEWQTMRKCNVLVDFLFYRNHPELNGRSIRSHEISLAQEWERIRDRLDGCEN